MHNNYYFLRQLTSQLAVKLNHASIAACFSQNKDELILGLIVENQNGKKDDFFIKAYLHNNFCSLQFPDDFNRSNKNSVNIFPEIMGLQVENIRQFINERSFAIRLKNEDDNQAWSLLFKMHGNRANVILCKHDQAYKLFKNNLAKDLTVKLSTLDNNLDQSWENFRHHNGDYTKLFPTFGKIPENYLQEQGYFSLDSPEAKWELIQQLHEKLLNPENYLITRIKEKTYLSLLPTGDTIQKKKDPIEALNAFFLTYIREESLEKEKTGVLKKLHKEQKHAENYIQKTQRKLEQIKTGTGNEEIANIIMANLHNIPEYAEKVTLTNFYDNQPITIKLKKHLSPQKNAETYYKKAKNQKIELQQLQDNIDSKQKHLDQLNAQIDQIRKADNIRDLRKYLKEQGLEKVRATQQKPVPYKYYRIDGFEILVGKNAASNDDLLREYTWKDDLWLHARDVPGSHVIIKQQAGKKIPDHVLEEAAKLAAQHSKRKSDTYCPVIYTPRKYVRKTKDLPPGEVIVDKEEVIMVEPGEEK